MTKQRILGILSLLSLLLPVVSAMLQGQAVNWSTLIPAAIAGLGLILHPPTSGGSAAPAK